MESTNLYFKEGSSDKVYHATLEKENDGYVVNFAYGRRGSALKTGSKTSSPVSLEKAREIYNKLIKEKMAKGYRHMDVESGTSIPVVKDLPDTPTEIKCVLLNPIDEEEAHGLLDNNNWGVQQKFDGIRFMLSKENDNILALNRKGKRVSVPNALAKCVEGMVNFFADGELIGDTYFVFDVLEIDGKCIRSESALKRSEALKELFVKSDNIVPVDLCVGEGKKKLFDSLVEQDKEGIVFKKLDAPYNIGRPASGGNYLKHKFYSTASCVVTEVNHKRSVAISLFSDGVSVPVGNVTIPINFDIPSKGDIVEIKYLYAYKGGSLYQPIYLGKREDIDVEECVLTQLKYKSEES
jgi:bifunctional non-homologous end joining protein LigD